jgi:6-phosphogluconolactonase (cycloisomerase 2 family)
MLRLLPTLATLALCGALAGACGRSPYSIANGSPTPTGTITTSPSVGNFLYSSNFADGKVGVFTRNVNTGVLAFVGPAGAGSTSGPMGIANGPSAKFLYVVNSADNNVRQYKINGSTGKLAQIGGGTVAAGTSPQWIAVTPNGQFAYAINLGGGTITPYTVDATSGVLTANGTAFSSVKLKKPATAVASNSFLYVTDTNNGSIVSFPIGASGTLSGGTAAVLATLPAVANPGPAILDSSGQFVYVTDASLGVVYFLNVGTGVLTLANAYTSTVVGAAVGLAIAHTSSGNNFLYVTNQTVVPPSITGFQVAGNGALSLVAGTPFTDVSLGQPTGVVIDPTGSFLYVANQSKGTISRFSIDPTTGALSAGAPIATESTASGPLYLALGQ